MKLKGLVALIGLSLPIMSFASTISFDNRTSKSDSTIRLHIGGGGAGACSNSPMVQKMTGNEGVTHPKERNEAPLTPQVEAVLCKNNVCKADLFMNGSCYGEKLATVVLPLGGMASVSPEVVGGYRFTGITNGVIISCADGTDQC